LRVNASDSPASSAAAASVDTAMSEQRPVYRFSLGRGHALCFVADLIDECGAAVSAGARLAAHGVINHK